MGMIDTKDPFFQLVRDMRLSQKAYFKYRDAGNLQESKRLEREVDKYIAKAEEASSQLLIEAFQDDDVTDAKVKEIFK